MIIAHWSEIPWDKERWKNFHPKEFSSPDNGHTPYWPEFYDRLQWARTKIGRPLRINSAYRSWRHNIAVGGAARSEHKKLAVDISLVGHDRFEVKNALIAAGFTGMGYYQTFIHADLGRKRFWYGGKYSQKVWTQ